MLHIAEEEVSGFYVLVYNVVVVAISQCRCRLQCNASELVQVAVQLVVVECSALQIFHQLIVAVHSLNINLAEIEDAYNHLKLDVCHHLHQLSLYGEIGIVYLQHEFLSLILHEKHLCLARVVAQAFQFPVYLALYLKRLFVNVLHQRLLRPVCRGIVVEPSRHIAVEFNVRRSFHRAGGVHCSKC